MAQGRVPKSSMSDAAFWVLMCALMAGALAAGMAFALGEISDAGWVAGGALGVLVFGVGTLLLARNAILADLPPPNTLKAPVAPKGGAFQAPKGAGAAQRAAAAPEPAPVASFADRGAAAGDVVGKAAYSASAAVTSAAQAARDAIAGVMEPARAEPVEVARPAGLAGPREGAADDLKRIKGVGPKLEELLHSLGFYHFDQIAAWGPAELAWVDSNLEGFNGRATRDDWVGQSKILAAGGETEHSQKVDRGEAT